MEDTTIDGIDDVSRLFAEMSGSQTGGPNGYSITRGGAGFDSVPAWAGTFPNASDYEFLVQFTNVNGVGDRHVNFDWAAGNPNVSLDRTAAVPEPGTLSLLGLASIGLLGRWRCKKVRKGNLGG